MSPTIRFAFPLLVVAAAGAAVHAADLPFASPPPPVYGDLARLGPGSGGFRVAAVPVRPVPLRYDVYGYPLLPRVPSPLALGTGCPPAVQPDYDAEGNFAGYAPIPMCR